DRDDDHVGELIEAGQVFGAVVARFVQAARIEEVEQRRLGRREQVGARKTRARLKALADLGVIGTGEKLDDAGLAALSLAEQPEDRDGSLPSQLVELGL